jgi:hypothetical protein
MHARGSTGHFSNFSCGPIVHVRSPILYFAVLTVFEFAKLSLPPEIANSFPLPVNRWDSAPTVIQILDLVYAHREDFRLTRNEKRYLKSLDVFN